MENLIKNKKPLGSVSVVVMKDEKILLGKRKGSHGAGDYAAPGGKLDWQESFEDCAKRELMEEVGVEIQNIRFLRVLNYKFYEKHFVDVGLIADWKSGEPKILEPEKCEEWGWYDLDNLPSPLVQGFEVYIEAYRTGKNYFDK